MHIKRETARFNNIEEINKDRSDFSINYSSMFNQNKYDENGSNEEDAL